MVKQAKLINLKDLLGGPAAYLPYIGGKAAGLVVMQALTLPCPGTWVVTTGLFTAFRKLAAEEIDKTHSEALLKKAADFVAVEIGDAFNSLPRLNYAVRSSATVEDAAALSFAGMFESFLNVTPEELPLAIARVWLSGLGERVRAYSHDPAAWPDMAVVLQPMVDAQYAGVCFSRHPAPQDVRDAGRALVEIVSGIGEQLVRGEVTPITMTGSFANMDACLDKPWLRELAAAAQRLEQFTGGPVDVEFAVDRQERLQILQQRPVTAITECHAIQLAGYRKAYKRTICSLDIEFLIDGCARYLAPYLELSLDLTRWMVLTTNAADGQQELWVHELLDETVIKTVCARILNDHCYMERLAHRYDRHHRQILNWRAAAWADEKLPLADRLQDFFEFTVPLNAHYYAPMHIIEALSLLLLDYMKKTDPAAAEDDFFKLSTYGVSTLGQVFTGQCRNLQEEISRELATLPDQYKALLPRWQQAVDGLAAGFGFLNCRLPYETPYDSEAVYSLMMENIPCDPDHEEPHHISELESKYTANPQCAVLLALLRDWLNRRNKQMEYLYYIYAQARPLLKAVGDKTGLSLEEVWRSNRAGLLNALAAEKAGTAEAAQTGANSRNRAKYDQSKLCMYHDGQKVCFRGDARPVYAGPAPDDAQLLKGRTVYGSGEITGTVRVAFSPDEVSGIEDGDGVLIVVTGMTTPDFVPALTQKAAALITDEGGILCHAAIIAREIRLPCIVGTGVATEKLADGSRVTLNLDRGEIHFFT